jgi:hypothetical protein
MPDVDYIQLNRKKNLNKIVNTLFDGNVSNFTATLEKNKLFVYGLLSDIDKPSSRNITDKTARVIERRLSLPENLLDQKSIPNDLRISYIKFVDISQSESKDELILSNESIALSTYIFEINRLDTNNLFATRIGGQVYIFNKAKNSFIHHFTQIYYIKLNHNFLVSRISRNFNNNKFLVESVIPFNHFEKFYVANLDNFQCLGTAVMNMSTVI